jgi:protein gp37
MGANSEIQWCEHTFNIAWGCTKVSDGCKLCYADTLSHRYGFDVWGVDKPRRTFGEKHWNEPLAWNRKAEQAGEIHRVFCSSMCDVFEDHPTLRQEREKLFPLIEATPHLDWLMLTKRPENMLDMVPEHWRNPWPANVIAMTTVEHQKTADRIAELYEAPALRCGLSCEPLLGPVDLSEWILDPILPQIDWVICGGESGPGCRPMQIEWALSLQAQCEAAGVAFFMKQLGGHPHKRGALSDFPAQLQVREYPHRLSKKGERA